jgi:uncharacterized protein YjbI with pentapeptide repeats
LIVASLRPADSRKPTSQIPIFHKARLKDCEFINVDFRVSGLNDSQFKYCVFTKCDFRQTSFVGCQFKNCKFLNCAIVDTVFTVKNILNVKFTGRLEEVNFIADGEITPLYVDFKECYLDAVSFRNCDLGTVVPPEDTRHAYFRNVSCRAKKAIESIYTRPESPSNTILKRRLLKLSAQRGAIFNIKNLEDSEGIEMATMLLSLLNGSQ